MCLILVGQTELWESKLRFKRYAAITQRIDINISLSPLSRAECAEYINVHLEYAGCKAPIFPDKAIDEIYKASGGIERVINKVCDKSLMYAAQQNLRLIDDHVVNTIREHETIMIGK